MAASAEISDEALAWTAEWYFRPETLEAASGKKQQNALTSAMKEYGTLRRAIYAALKCGLRRDHRGVARCDRACPLGTIEATGDPLDAEAWREVTRFPALTPPHSRRRGGRRRLPQQPANRQPERPRAGHA